MSLSSTSKIKRIFCYGDSLTEGTSPPLFESFPYAPHLESSLRQKLPMHDIKVDWFGLPGWTASSMVDNLASSQGLTYLLNQATPKPDLVILLCGTNDLGYQPPPDSDPTKISNSIMKLHEVAHEYGSPTIAISIPPSAWQASSNHARNLAQGINTCLEEFCSSSKKNAVFVPFPIPNFGKYDDGEDVWCPDGLHFSPRGYQVLGEYLSSHVTEILDC